MLVFVHRVDGKVRRARLITQDAQIINASQFQEQFLLTAMTALQADNIFEESELYAHVMQGPRAVQHAQKIINQAMFYGHELELGEVDPGEPTEGEIVLSSLNVEENSIRDMLIGSLSVEDGEPGEVFTYSLLNSNGGRFKIVDDKVFVDVALREEFTRDMAATRSIRVRALGNISSDFEKLFALNIARTVGFDPRYCSTPAILAALDMPFDGARKLYHNSASNIVAAYGDAILSGKRYFEVEFIGSGTISSVAIGVGCFGLHGLPASTGPGVYWTSAGTRSNDGTQTNSALPTFTYGDRLMVALDTTTGDVWFGKGGTWANSGNPATGANPAVTMNAAQRTRLLRPVVRLAGLGGAVTARHARIYGESGHLLHAPPSGFSALVWTPPSPTIFAGQVHASMAISNGGRTATKISGSGTFNTAIANSGIFGKMVFAFRIDRITGIARVGLQVFTDTTGTNAFNATSYRSDTGVTANEGSTTGTPTYATWTTNDIVMVAYDRATGDTWFGKNGVWNGDPTNPVTAAFQGGVFRNLPYCGVTNINDAITLLGGADYPYEIPAGFRVFDDHVAFDPPPLVDEDDPEPTPQEDDEIEPEIPADDPDPDPVDTDPDNPDPAIVESQQQKWNLEDASLVLLSDPLFKSGKRILRHREDGSVRGFNPIYGRKYWEIVYRYPDLLDDRAGCVGVGTLDADIELPPGEDENGAGYNQTGKVRHDETDVQTYPTWATGYAFGLLPGDRIGVAFDSITRNIWFAKNGVWQGAPGIASIGTATISLANPAVVTRTSHGLVEGHQIYFTTTNTLPSSITAGTRYYVRNKTANTFNISATPTGSLISTASLSQSGTHTIHHGSGTGPALALPAGEYYPMVWLSDRVAYMSWRKIGYVTTAFAAFSPGGGAFNQRYAPPAGFTAFAPY